MVYRVGLGDLRVRRDLASQPLLIFTAVQAGWGYLSVILVFMDIAYLQFADSDCV